MLKAKAVAEYFLTLYDSDAGDLISNMKLQKLLYYAQGVYLVARGKPLFREQIKAWMHGPVVPAVYHAYKGCGNGAIAPPSDVDFTQYSDEQRQVLNEVHNVLGQYSAWRLRSMTHEEPPWRDAYARGWGNVITHDALRAYFTQIVTND